MNDVEFNSEMTLIASASADGTVGIWNVENGQPRGDPLDGHDDWVSDVEFNSAGTLIVSAGVDGTVRLWDVATGQQSGRELSGHRGMVVDVEFNSDGTLIVSAGADGTVRLWDVATGQQSGRELSGHRGMVVDVEFNSDGTLIVSAGADGTVRLWDVATGQQSGRELSGHRGMVVDVEFNSDGTLIVSAGVDGTVRLWDVATGQQSDRELSGHRGMVVDVEFNSDGTLIVSVGDDGTLRLWHRESGRPVSIPPQPSHDNAKHLAFTPYGLLVASSTDDHKVGFSTSSLPLTPGLWIWALVLWAIFNIIVLIRIAGSALRRRTTSSSVSDLSVPELQSDKPIDNRGHAPQSMVKVVDQISDYVRNPHAATPLTFAITGRWGSGKTSLMTLISHRLTQNGCPCVWFNAWHHQNETHLFASLMESIRRNAVTRRDLYEHVRFRLNLARIRWNENRTRVVLFLLLVVFGLLGFILITVLKEDGWQISVPGGPLYFLILFWRSRWNPLGVGLKLRGSAGYEVV